jgi:hypothetical protein
MAGLRKRSVSESAEEDPRRIRCMCLRHKVLVEGRSQRQGEGTGDFADDSSELPEPGGADVDQPLTCSDSFPAQVELD